MADLRAEPPRVFVVQRDDVFPRVTGNELDSHTVLTDFDELKNFLLGSYELVHTIGKFDLLVRRSPAR
jgi:hypothetical protein